MFGTRDTTVGSKLDEWMRMSQLTGGIALINGQVACPEAVCGCESF